MKFLAAVRFLTIIPLPGRREVSPEEVGRSIVYFPLVGVIIGLILVGLNWLLGLFLPSALVTVLLVVSLVVISGALHLDGFVDTCDGIGGHKTVEERWRVMQDSRAGGFGIIGVCCLLLVKYVSMSGVPDSWLMQTLVLMPVVSRWAMVYAVFAYSYAKPSGLGKVFKQGASWQRFVIATFITLAVAVILAQLTGFVIMLAIWVIVIAMAAYLKGKFGGLTGDTYGAINEVAEVCVLILVCLLAHIQWLG
ncbi:MAG: adenosylcobinamide-GDP ribazoletransferase [Dehalococcoidia bacterium]|nr:adenosylcobinamide-GDP ribazoletransferase [Dehalococcoidia bacterium]MBL7124830.1 adenosylcobinamide-GDP ribazoletransferase [Dehalococcoidales bacterium]